MPALTKEKIIVANNFNYITDLDTVYGFDVIPSNANVEDLINYRPSIRGGDEIPYSWLWNLESDITSTIFRPNCYIKNNVICIDLDFTKIYKYNSLVLVYYDDDYINKSNVVISMKIACIVSIKDYVNQTNVQDLNDYSHNFLYIDLNFLPNFNTAGSGFLNKFQPLPHNSGGNDIPSTSIIDHLHKDLFHFQTFQNRLANSLEYISSYQNCEVNYYPENRTEQLSWSTNFSGNGFLLDTQYSGNDQGEAGWIIGNESIINYLQGSQINKEYSNIVQFDDLYHYEMSN